MPGKTFVQRRHLTWGEADPAGTIYAPRAIDIAIQAIEALWIEALGLSFREMQLRYGVGMPWVHTACEFAKPLRAGDPFDVRIVLDKIGESSLKWRGDAVRPDGESLFRLNLVSVMIDLKSGKAQPIPAEMRVALAEYVVSA